MRDKVMRWLLEPKCLPESTGDSLSALSHPRRRGRSYQRLLLSPTNRTNCSGEFLPEVADVLLIPSPILSPVGGWNVW